MQEAIVFNVVTTLLPLILAIAVHEWAHVAMARFLGDPTGTAMGRYTLNPLAHVDPIWTVALPVYFIITQTIAGSAFVVPFVAAGKPAPYSPIKLDRRFNGKRITMSLGEALVAFAGPFSNLVMAALTTGLVIALVRSGQSLDFENDPRSLAILAMKFVVLNISLFLFNLIPVPPLDGSKIMANLLPHGLAQSYRAFVEKAGTLLLIVLFIGGARYLLAPVQGAVLSVIWSVIDAATRGRRRRKRNVRLRRTLRRRRCRRRRLRRRRLTSRSWACDRSGARPRWCGWCRSCCA